ncbi:MAG TPA: START domain-containing protein [Chitinophaga sp.]|uniref:START domain-containing protein n=1 Tax=Chitinophaga sp. TaxID=1869181 RepID=UPI002CDC718D|nr:START domain-containing protein [Chitinophaga sp.]HVI44918.1 START domain-containing protein [Chitinophaga sp.]
MKFLQSLLLILSIITGPKSAMGAQNTEGFRLVKQDGAISLYERWIAAAGGEKVREIKAVFMVHTTPTAVADLLRNQARGTQWNINASTYRIIPLPDHNHWITYIQYDIPWPVDDQDCCLSYHFEERQGNAGASVIAFESTTHSQFPVSSKITRITGTRGKWVLEEQQNGNVGITYLVTTDRNRKIPRWVSDPIIHDNLFKTMRKFKNILEGF